jgi:acyl-CoA thioesterase-2
MADLALDTAVDGKHGRYRATVSGDWEIWGPMGGYVASIAFRAIASEVSAELQPASFTCQFLSTAKFDAVDIEVKVRRESRRAAAVTARVIQDGREVLDAQAWFAAANEVVTHDYAKPHRHGHPDDHPLISAYTDEPARFAFWNNFESKPLDWIEDPETFEGGDPEWAQWVKFVPAASFDDPVLEAVRLLLLADLPSFPAAMRAHPGGPPTFMSPSLDLAVQFHRIADLGEWLLIQGVSPIADRGLMAFRSEVWTAAGVLAASGSGQLLLRSVTPA